MLKRLTVLPLCFVIALAGCRKNLSAPEPTREETWVDSVPASPAGIIVAPLTVHFVSALARLEAEIPRTFGDMEQRLQATPEGRSSYAFSAERGPFAVRLVGDTILAAATIQYQGRGWYDPPIGPTITGGCGMDSLRPRARLTLRIVAGLDSSWRLRTRIRLTGVEPLSTEERDQCEVSFLKIDVTGKVLTAAETAIAKALPALDRQIAEMDVRSPIEVIWREMLEPIKITDSLWLVLRPEAVSMGRIAAQGEGLTSRVSVRARPGLLTGAKPERSELPLPALRRGDFEEGFAMLVEGRFDYPVISDMITKALAATPIETPRGTIQVEHVRVIGLGRGRVGLGLTFSGSTSGTVWLVGSPVFDSTSRFITVPDLEFDASSAGLLVRGLAWLKGPEITAFLRKEARVPADSLLRELGAMAERETNRELAPGVRLGADITSAEPVGIHAGQFGLVIRARATGTASLELGPELFRRKPAARSVARSRDVGGALASGSRRTPPGD